MTFDVKNQPEIDKIWKNANFRQKTAQILEFYLKIFINSDETVIIIETCSNLS